VVSKKSQHQRRSEKPEIADGRGGRARTRHGDGPFAGEQREAEHNGEYQTPAGEIALVENRIERTAERLARDQPARQRRQGEAKRECPECIQCADSHETQPYRHPAQRDDAENRQTEQEETNHLMIIVRRP
jgi:hypothetical protein